MNNFSLAKRSSCMFVYITTLSSLTLRFSLQPLHSQINKNMSLEIPLAWLFTATLTILTFLCISSLTRRKPRQSLPPGPMPLPVIGNLHQLGGGHLHRSLLSLSQKFGDLMHLRLGSFSTLVVSSADAARDIFKNHDLTFSSRPAHYALTKFSYQRASMSVAPYGEHWRGFRKIAVLELLTHKQVQSFEHVRVQEVSRTIEWISKQAPGPVDLSVAAFTLVNDIVYRVVFGAVDLITNERLVFKEGFHELQNLLGSMNIADYIPWLGWINKFNGMDNKLEKCFQDMDRFFEVVIQGHVDSMRAESEHQDIVDVMLRLQKDPNQTIRITNDQIKGMLIDLFVAGTDTSTATIVWAMTELHKNPEAKRTAQQEVRDLAKGKSRIEESDLPNLTYLKQVIKETLRIHPPVPTLVPRETIENCTINEQYQIPKGTRVIFNAVAIQTDPKHWENPNEFKPERFADGKIDFRGQHFELLPFGTGRRGCPGINFAMPVVELALANLLYKFDWASPMGMTAEDIDVEEGIGVAVLKKNPLCLVATLVN